MRDTRSSSTHWRIALVVCGLLALAGGAGAVNVQSTEAIQASGEIPEDSLLDVGIQILNPGLPPGDSYSLEKDGIFKDIRKSESRFLPVVLMDTLQATGQWGAVRVVPAGTDSVDLAVSGQIIESTGRKLVLQIRAQDASGRLWLDNRYKQIAEERAYYDEELDREPFQDTFNQIANDLLEARQKLTDDELREVRTVASLKFAADLAPIAFADYLAVDKKGLLTPVRLPADDDPVMARVTQIRERDHLFIDTLTEYYANFSAQMNEPYENWRKFSYDEEVAARKLKRKARWQKILGGAAILGSLLMDGSGSEGSAVREIGVIGGSMAIQAGIGKSQEVKLHLEALRELASSFDSEVAPLLIEVEGQTLRLSGSVESQYVNWRQLMRDFFITETGLPVDPDTGLLVAADAPE